MKELSIFVDESGDFGPYEKHAPYYIVSLVFHEQEKPIARELQKLDTALACLGYPEKHAIHTAPLIRREYPYGNFQPNERRAIFTKLYAFTINCDISYKSFVFKKSEYDNIFNLEAKIAKELSKYIREHLPFFHSFDKIILYYDNGQHELNKILNMVLATELSSYEIRKVLPNEYRLFQVADLLCTLELLRLKTHSGSLTSSETLIFHSKRDLKKDFLKGITKKEFK